MIWIAHFDKLKAPGRAEKNKTRERRIEMYKIVIDKDKCTGCENCVDICPFEVFEMVDEKSEAVRPEDCEGCLSCVESCAEEAITVEEM